MAVSVFRRSILLSLYIFCLDVTQLKQVMYVIFAIIAVLGTYYLYSKQLGAIAFFLMSIFLFYIAIRQLRKLKESQDGSDDTLNYEKKVKER